MHALVVGRPGAGKSTITKRLVELSARVIVLDQRFEYGENARAHVVYDLADASAYFLAHRAQQFELVFRPTDPADSMDLLEIAMYAQECEPHGPLVIVGEEFSNYSETQNIPDTFRRIYNEGRHLRLSLISVIQYDTDIHRLTRNNSQIVIAMQLRDVSGPLGRVFAREQVTQLQSLQQSGFVEWPEQGVHFLVDPDVPLYDTWVAEHGWLAVPVDT